jgi:hypothetical protein
LANAFISNNIENWHIFVAMYKFVAFKISEFYPKCQEENFRDSRQSFRKKLQKS